MKKQPTKKKRVTISIDEDIHDAIRLLKKIKNHDSITATIREIVLNSFQSEKTIASEIKNDLNDIKSLLEVNATNIALPAAIQEYLGIKSKFESEKPKIIG